MLMFIVMLYYGVKMNEGAIVPAQFMVMSVVGWSEYILGGLLLKFKGMHYERYKWVLGIGYLTYFIFITWSAMDEIYEKVFRSITETVELIQINIEKMESVDQSVTGITNDAVSLGGSIKTVDSAVKEVETSNKTLSDNMQQVCELMETMTGRITLAEQTTREMLSKYIESAKSAVGIEKVVGHLMEELGVGGFMGVQDIRPGMKIAVTMETTESPLRRIPVW